MPVIALLFLCVLLHPSYIMCISCTLGLQAHPPIKTSSSQRYVLEGEFLAVHSPALVLLLEHHICYLDLRLVLPRFSHGLLTLFGQTLWASDPSAPSPLAWVSDLFCLTLLVPGSDAGLDLEHNAFCSSVPEFSSCKLVFQCQPASLSWLHSFLPLAFPCLCHLVWHRDMRDEGYLTGYQMDVTQILA